MKRFGRTVATASLVFCVGFGVGAAHAGVGLLALPATADDGPVTVFYPTDAPDELVKRGPFQLSLAPGAAVQRGNGRLVVISHGSGGAPWVHADLARRLVQDGFVVAMPEHRADNASDPSNPGPDSWRIRPGEVSRAIDAVGRDTRFAPLLDLNKVGVYGMSAGGHTALSMAGGRWSAAGFKHHCEANLVADFGACVGLYTRLRDNWLDGIKMAVALWVIRLRFADETVLAHDDPRVAAVVAGVPAAADFDKASLGQPRVPLALITAAQDRWLVPRFHSDAVLSACKPCEHLADLPNAGHGALLSPPPPGLTGLVGDLLNDPPGFDRSRMPAVDTRISAYFRRHLVD